MNENFHDFIGTFLFHNFDTFNLCTEIFNS